MLKDAVVMSPVYPSLLFANVPMVAMIFVLLQSGSRDCGLDGGAGDGRRSACTRRARASQKRPDFRCPPLCFSPSGAGEGGRSAWTRRAEAQRSTAKVRPFLTCARKPSL